MCPGQPPERTKFDRLLEELADWLRQTSKLILTSLALLIVGFFGGPIAGSGFFWFLFIIGLILFFVCLYQRYGISLSHVSEPSGKLLANKPVAPHHGLPRVLGKEQVLDNWTILIKNGQGQAEMVFENTERFIAESRAPDIEMERQFLAPGIIRGMFGANREFLIVKNNTNSRLKTYRMYINARDYGNNLHVSDRKSVV